MFSCVALHAQTLGVDPIEQVIAKMSNGDKAHMVQGMGIIDTYVGSNQVAGASGYTWNGLTKLGIPQVVLVDGPCGVRLSTILGGATCFATHFPVGTALASTWDTQLVEETTRAIGDETKEYGCDILLAPGINIQRHPLCGRNFEYYSEDPLLAGKIGAAYIRGVQSMGVGVSLKHFAANNQETNRKSNDSRINQRALREIYLRPFEIAVKEGHPWTVMSSYNKLNGTYTGENYDLLTTLLRDEWGFDGMVTTDWITNADATKQLRAGNDMLMPGSSVDWQTVNWDLMWGKLAKADINRDVQRVLEMIMRTPRFHNYAYSNAPDLDAHALVARRAAADGQVLLENRHEALPLSPSVHRVALFGSLSYRTIAGGTGSGNVTSRHITRLPEAFTTAGYEVDDDLLQAYEEHIKAGGTDDQAGGMLGQQIMPATLPSELLLTEEQIQRAAAQSDVAILTIGRTATEAADRTEDEYYLSADEAALLPAVCQAFHSANKQVVVVLNISGPIEMYSWRDLPDAILLSWLGGQECGNAIVDVLSGKVCPSGKLAQTLPIDYRNHPSAVNFPVGTNIGEDVTTYAEDIFVGYRYFDTYQYPVLYPFGYGLSYTTFAYSSFNVEQVADSVQFSVNVMNTGQVAGREVVQIYAQTPGYESLKRPMKELKAFGKTRLLQPGESETLFMSIAAKDLSYFDAVSSAWYRPAGDYQFFAAASVEDVRLQSSLSLAEYSETVNNILAPPQPIEMLKLEDLEFPTAVPAVGNVQSSKVISGTPESIYNLAGQRISNPLSGVNIVNGKKVVK